MCNWKYFTLLVREPETRKVGNDACVNVSGVKYQLSAEFAGEMVTLLWGLLDNGLRISYKGESYGPFYPAAGPIPFNSYRPFKKTSKEKYIDKIEKLAQLISVPKSALTNDDSVARELINSAGLADEPQASVAFASDNPFETMEFKDAVEAKAAIARWVWIPFGTAFSATD